VTLGDAGDHGQPESAAGPARRAAGLAEGLEDPLAIGGRDADPVVADLQAPPALLAGRP
jgi:hypothetical protein